MGYPLNNTDPIDGYTLFRTDEFKALCELLNIDLSFPIIDISIHLPLEGIVTAVVKYQGRTTKPALKEPEATEAHVVDTTTQHNEKWRTKQPWGMGAD